jgi:hypothetical protein
MRFRSAALRRAALRAALRLAALRLADEFELELLDEFELELLEEFELELLDELLDVFELELLDELKLELLLELLDEFELELLDEFELELLLEFPAEATSVFRLERTSATIASAAAMLGGRPSVAAAAATRPAAPSPAEYAFSRVRFCIADFSLIGYRTAAMLPAADESAVGSALESSHRTELVETVGIEPTSAVA